MKKIVIGIAVLLFGLIVWYFFVKEFDYQMSFKVKANPASLFYEIKTLKLWGEDDKNENIILLKTEAYTSVIQKINRENADFVLDWRFTAINDTITKVTVGVIGQEHTIRNRIQVITGSSPYVSRIKKEMIQFAKTYKDFTKTFKVEINGETNIPEMEYVSVSLLSKRSEKAGKMVSSNDLLYPKLIENNLKRNGYPFVKVNDWDDKDDTIKFDFGFPIQHVDSIPELVGLIYKKTPSQKALKATYYGNYKDSDQAWFCLLKYAKDHNIDIERKPLEIFYNNPMQGGNDLDWKTEIYLPLKE